MERERGNWKHHIQHLQKYLWMYIIQCFIETEIVRRKIMHALFCHWIVHNALQKMMILMSMTTPFILPFIFHFKSLTTKINFYLDIFMSFYVISLDKFKIISKLNYTRWLAASFNKWATTRPILRQKIQYQKILTLPSAPEGELTFMLTNECKQKIILWWLFNDLFSLLIN